MLDFEESLTEEQSSSVCRCLQENTEEYHVFMDRLGFFPLPLQTSRVIKGKVFCSSVGSWESSLTHFLFGGRSQLTQPYFQIQTVLSLQQTCSCQGQGSHS